MIVLPKEEGAGQPVPDDNQRIFARTVATHHRNLMARGVYGDMDPEEALVISVLGALATWKFPRSGQVLAQVELVREEQEERARANGVTRWQRERSAEDNRKKLLDIWDRIIAARRIGE